MSRLSVGSLFSGIGGLDLGLERAGMDVRWQCEIDKAARSVLRRHFPDATLYDDVTTFGGEGEPVDLICGGFPCQDLSVAGRRAGLAGERSGLFYEFMRIASELAPRWLLIENVPGLLSSNGGRDMGAVLGTLGELGYGWAYRVLDAQYFGVAQRRRRVFIVGCLGDAARAAQVLLEPESCSGDSPPRREAGTRTAASVIKGAAIGRKPEAGPQYGEVLEDGTCYTLNCTEQHAVAACLNSGGNNGGFRTEPGEHLVTHALTAEGHDASEDGTGRGTPLVMAPAFSKRPGQQIATREDGLSYALTSGEPPRVLSIAQNQRGELRTGDVSPALQCGGGKPGEGYPCVAMTSEISPLSECCPTLKAQPGGLGYHANIGMSVRRLTPTECCRLQSFPDDWQEVYDADAEEAHAREVLHGLWREAGEEAREGRRSGIALALLTPEVLLAGVYGGWLSWERAAQCAAGAREVQGESAGWTEGFLRQLRLNDQVGPSPYRRESFEQLARELGRPVSALPLEGAQARAAVRGSWVWAQASAQWPLRYARPEGEEGSTGPLSDSARYRQLGNAVCVNVAEWIGRRIMEVAS